MTTRMVVLLRLALTSLAWGMCATTENQLPNVVILLADDLGFGDLSSQGHPTTRTPNIDSLAVNGRSLTHFYVPVSICSPSRAALLTGRYPIRSGTYPLVYSWHSELGLPKNETTIAQLLKQKGYQTLMLGKWHLGFGKNNEYLPTNFGFDEFFGLPYTHHGRICFPNNSTCESKEGNATIEKNPCPLFSDTTIVQQPVYLPELTEQYAERAKNFIKSSQADGKPFFLYLPFDHVHMPQFSGADFYLSSPRGQIGDAISELDWAVGQVLQAIKDANAQENTIVWFSSDNGPAMEFHQHGGSAGLLRCAKGTTFDGGIRVPSIVTWPGTIKPGKSNALTSNMDMLPTLAAIAGISTSNLTLDGLDITSVLMDPDIKGPREFFASYNQDPDQSEGPFTVHHGQYKAHYWTKGDKLADNSNYDPMCGESHALTRHDPPLLFDLYQDPGERYNLAGLPEYQNELKIIEEWRNQHMASVTWMPPRTQLADPSITLCCKPGCEPFPSCCRCNNIPYTR